jgi:large subunit ribosomal protein L15
VRLGFEGGQMPLQRRIPKRGFTNIFRKQYNIINIKDLSQFNPNATLGAVELRKSGMVNRVGGDIKLLGNGEISHPVTIQVQKVTKTARSKIEAAGGKVELI